MKAIKVKERVEGYQVGDIVSPIEVIDSFFATLDVIDFDLQILVDKAIRIKLYTQLEVNIPPSLHTDETPDGRVGDITSEFNAFFEKKYRVVSEKG